MKETGIRIQVEHVHTRHVRRDIRDLILIKVE